MWTKLILGFIALTTVTSCTSEYLDVEQAAFNGNPHAKELLLAGFNRYASSYISTVLIQKALAGDEEAKAMVIAQTWAMH